MHAPDKRLEWRDDCKYGSMGYLHGLDFQPLPHTQRCAASSVTSSAGPLHTRTHNTHITHNCAAALRNQQRQLQRRSARPLSLIDKFLQTKWGDDFTVSYYF